MSCRNYPKDTERANLNNLSDLFPQTRLLMTARVLWAHGLRPMEKPILSKGKTV